jgi:hypothetical protein
MNETIFEAKYEIDANSEQAWAKKLGLEFEKAYEDTDYYLQSLEGAQLKLKSVGGKTVLYEVVFEDGMFRIAGRQIDSEERQKILQNHPKEIEINRRKKVYLLKSLMVKVDFDYMKQFPDRLFLEIHSNSRWAVLQAKKHVAEFGLKEVVTVPYNKLREAQRNP